MREERSPRPEHGGDRGPGDRGPRPERSERFERGPREDRPAREDRPMREERGPRPERSEGGRPRRDEPQAGERGERRPMRDAAGPRDGGMGGPGAPARAERPARPATGGGLPMADFEDDVSERPAPAQDVGKLESLDSVLGDAPRRGRSDRGGDRRPRRD
jgi:ribonuclease E